MPAANPPENEQVRLDRLHRMAVLDSDAEPLFDALTQAAAAVSGMPIALIGFLDTDRQWFKSNVGLPGVSETPRDGAMCAHTILGTSLLEVADVRQDSRFADSPLVTGSPGVRFYAGVPIILQDGLAMGTLCVIGHEPGVLDEGQRATLRALGQAAADALELRRYALQEQAALDHEAQALRDQKATDKLLATKLRESEAFLERTGRLAKVGGWELNVATKELVWSDQTCRIHDLPPGHQPTLDEAVGYYAPEYRSVIQSALDKAIADGDEWDLQLPMVTASGRSIWGRTVGAPLYDDDGQPNRLAGAFQDVTARARVVAALEASDRRYRKLFEHSLGLICTHDHEGVVMSINPAAAKSLGFSVAELIGCSLTSRMRPERFPAFHDYMLRVMSNGTDSGLLEFVAKDGSLRLWEYHNVLDDDGDEPYVLGHAQDVTERRKHEQQLREWSIRDPLTSCYNRRYLAERVASDATGHWGCIAIDLDQFKLVNDTYGHQRGDNVLIGMADFLTAHVRRQDAVIRLGGDEFLILLRDADEALTAGVVERLNADRNAAMIAFTLGAVTLGRGQSLEEGLAEADRRLYKAREGRYVRMR